MHTFEYSDGTKDIGYDTLDELLNKTITYAAESTDSYFITIDSNSAFDNSMYKVDKKTGKASLIYFTDFIAEYAENAKEIDIRSLKGRAS